MARLETSIDSARASGKTLALLFIDLDGFKPVNDKLGHAVGDAVLKVVGHRLERSVRENDLFARIGGDEFVVVLDLDPHFHEVATRIAGSIIASIESPIREPDIGRVLSASIGIAFFPDHAADADALLRAADEQMYESKRRGKGTITVGGLVSPRDGESAGSAI